MGEGRGEKRASDGMVEWGKGEGRRNGEGEGKKGEKLEGKEEGNEGWKKGVNEKRREGNRKERKGKIIRFWYNQWQTQLRMLKDGYLLYYFSFSIRRKRGIFMTQFINTPSPSIKLCQVMEISEMALK